MPAGVWRCVHAPGDQYLPSLSIALHPSPHHCQPAGAAAPSAADRPAGGLASAPGGDAAVAGVAAGTAVGPAVPPLRRHCVGGDDRCVQRRTRRRCAARRQRRFENRATMRCLGGSGRRRRQRSRSRGARGLRVAQQSSRPVEPAVESADSSVRSRRSATSTQF